MVRLHCPTLGPIKRLIKMGWIELCRDVHTAQRQKLMQIHIGFYANLSVSLSRCRAI